MSDVESATHTVELGRVTDFDHLPAQLEIAGATYFLTRDGDEWLLLAAVCPHIGGQIEDRGKVFQCPNHSWTFDVATGAPVRFALQGMSRYPIEDRDGVLLARVEPDGWDGIRARQRRDAMQSRRRPTP